MISSWSEVDWIVNWLDYQQVDMVLIQKTILLKLECLFFWIVGLEEKLKLDKNTFDGGKNNVIGEK